MSVKEDAVLNELKFKVERLLKRYTASLQTIEEQRGRIEEMGIEIGRLESERKNLNEELKTAKVAGAISGTNGGSYDAKIRINQLVREIDKCIALLNN